MKKITLTSIIVFVLIVTTLYVGSQVRSKSANNQITNPAGATVGADKIFKDIDISNLNFTSKNTPPDTITMNEAVKHSSKNDCYLIINNNVYDASGYISYHPGGSRTITSRCGKEVTGIFAKIHSNRAWDLLKKYKVGSITTNQPDTTPQMLNAIEKALKDTNPGVDVLKVAPKTDFYIAKLIFNNKLYEIHINSAGKIIQEEVEAAESDWSLWENDNDDK